MTTARATAAEPSIQRRLAIAIAIGLASGVAAWLFLRRPGFSSDFFHFWSAARTLLHGRDPYLEMPTGPLNPQRDPLLYPLPAVLLLLPLAALPLSMPAAGGVFIAISSALLAIAITRNGFARLPIFLSAPFVMAVSLGQWSPLLSAAALTPAAGIALAAKPNLGVAAWLYRPNWRAVVGAVVVLAVSLVVLPRWPIEWLHNIRGREGKFIPLLSAVGVVAVLAAVRWRQPEGRLVLAMACVPQTLFFYDQLPLLLSARTLKESTGYAMTTLLLLVVWLRRLAPGDLVMHEAIPYVLLCYWPAVLLVLRHRDAAPATGPADVSGDSDRSAPVRQTDA